MKTWLKIAIGIAALLIVAVVTIPFWLNANTFRPLLETQLSTTLGRVVKVGDLRLSLLSGTLVAADLNIADDPNYSSNAFLTAKQLRVGVEMKPLILSRQLKVRSFAVVAPQVHLVREANGSWNFSEIGRNAAGRAGTSQQSSAIRDVTAALITVEDGRAVVENLPAEGAPRIFEHFNLSVRQFSLAAQFPFTLSASLPGDAAVTVSGDAGPINLQDAALTAIDAQTSMKHLDPIATGLLDANVGVSMLADLDAHVTSDGQTLTSNGKIHMARLRLRKGGGPTPNAVDLKYKVAQGLRETVGQIEDATVSTGNVAIHLSGTYQLRTKNPSLRLKMTGKSLPIDELQALLTAAEVKLPNGATLKGGTLDIAFALSGVANALVITGPVEADNTQVVGFDLGSRIHGIAALSKLKTGDTTSIEQLRLDLRVTDAGTEVENIYAKIPAMGELSGSGTVSPASALDFKLTVKVTAAHGIGKLGVGLLTKLNKASIPGEVPADVTGVPMLVTGTANEPVITADVHGLLQRNKESFLARFRKKK